MADFYGGSSDSGSRMGIKTSIWAETNDPANNRTYVRFRVELYDNNGSLGGYATITGSWSWSGGSGGINQYVDFTGNSGRSYVVVDTGAWIGHDYNYGTASVSGSASTNANSPIGSASAGGSIGLSDYYRGPNSPYYTNITRNSTGDYFTIAYAATGASNSGPGVTYVLERATDAGMSQNYITISGSHSVNPNTTYYFRMYAYNPDGTVYSGVYGPYYGVPSVPTGLTATPSTSVQNRITLSWATPSYTGSGITNYYIYRNGSYLGQTGSASTSYIDDTAVRGTTYSYTVAAYNGLGANGTSSSVNGTAPGVPFAATLDSVVASTNTFGKVSLSWTAPSTAVGTIQNYYMYAVYNSVIEKTVSTGTNVTSGEITGLDVRKTYTFYVRARNQFSVDNNTPGDVSNSIQRKSPGPPTAPTALTADAPFVPPGTVNLSWTAPSDVGTESGAITGYTVYLAGTSTPILTTTTTATTATITDLIPATSYTFVVRARNAIADTVGTFSDESNSATATAQGEPDAPTGLTVTADPVVAGRLILTWTPPVGYNTGFRVYDSAGTIIANIATPRYEIDGLLPNTGYSFRVRARNPLTDITGSEGGAISALASGTTGGSSAQTVPSLSVSNTTNATFVGTYNIVGTTATTFTYSKTATNIPFASIPVGGGSTVNNTNTNLNGTYSVTVVGTQATSKELTFSKSGSDIATNTATPSGTMYNNTNVIFNGSYEVAASPAPDSVAKTVSYSKVASNVSSRVASGTVTNNSNATYNGRYSVSAVTATQIKYAKTNADIAETLAFGTVYNKTNQDIFNGTFEVIRTPDHKTVEYSTGDLVSATNLITNPSMETVSTGTTTLRTNLCTNPGFEVNTTGWSAVGSATISRATSRYRVGTASLQVIPSVDNDGASFAFSGLTVGGPTTASAWVYSTIATSIVVSWFTDSSVFSIPAGAWTRVYQTSSTTPSATQTLTIKTPTASSGTFFIDTVLLEQTDQLRDYFSGATTSALGWTYSWSGTADASTSLAKAAAITVRTNLVANPSFETNTTGWTGQGTSSVVSSTAQAYVGSASGLLTASGSANCGVYTTAASVTAGAQYTASIYIRDINTAVSYRASIDWKDSGSTALGSNNGTVTAISSGGWTRVSVSGTAPAGAAIANVIFRSSTIPAAGKQVYFDAALFEMSAALGTYFDGSTAASGDFTFAWSGTANASTSVQYAPAVASITPNTVALSTQSSTWSSTGSSSLRITPTSSSNSSSWARFDLTTAIGTTYTAKAKIRLVSPLTGTLSGAARKLVAYDSSYSALSGGVSDQAPNTAGVTELSITFTATTTTTRIVMWNGALLGGGDVWWDDLIVVEGAYTGTYFDGDTDETSNTWPVVYTWSGTPHASTSVRTVGGTLPTVGAELLEPYGDAQRVQSEAQLQIRYRSGWLG